MSRYQLVAPDSVGRKRPGALKAGAASFESQLRSKYQVSMLMAWDTEPNAASQCAETQASVIG